MHGNFPSCKAMACHINNHHTCTSRFLALIILALLLAHPSNASWWTNRSTLGGGGGSNLQVPARCRPKHAAALLQLKQSFTFTPSSNGCTYDSATTTLSSWIQGTDCCFWEGVACDRVTGSVTGLDLSLRSLGINGSSLHPAIFNLTSLKHLVLDGNHFCGSQLPASGFEMLTRLEDLSLYSCDISGPIPLSFAGLRSLKTINLSFNNFSGSTFPLWITHLKQLKVLAFQDMDLSGTIPSSIGNLSLLTELNLGGNSFSGSTFPLWITHLKQLKVLVFQDMGLSGTIPSSIGNLSLLTELNLGGNSFSGGLPSSVSNLTYLSRLQCSHSGLSGRVASLNNLSRLEFLDLSFNNLQGNIPLSDGNILRNLQTVDMSSNSFTGKIQASIFSLSALQHLNLTANHLSGHIEEFQDPSGMLKEVYLSNNKLTGAIPTSFSQLTALTYLELNSNNFMGTLNLYPYLMLRNLSSITASNNPMLSVSAEDRSDSTNSSSITRLVFASCGLTSVPSLLKYLPKLDYLDLSNNSIHGNIPDWIWRNMTFLNLQHNLFTKVGQQPAHTCIDVLDLSFNKLEGSVPFLLKGRHLDYSNNKFSSIPSINFVLQFRTASMINLANNELSGPIYMECQQDDSIRILDLSGNQLSGPVPPSLLRSCSNVLSMLNLGSNNLSGILPDEMGESCSLHVIHLHGNQIQGHLPRSLASCKSLRYLDVGRNKFLDVFPSCLGNLPNLWFLILRSNKFYGPLTMPGVNTHSVENNYFSSLKIVDLAGNCFNGALPLEFFNVFKSMIHPQMNPDIIYMVNYSDCSQKYFPDGSHYSGDGDNNYQDSLDGGIYRDYSSCGDDYFDAFTLDELVKVQVSMKHLYLSVIKIRHDLVVIDLSDNRFSGRIPRTIGNLTALHVLNLSHNTLSGNIPAEFGRLSKVESLDLSWNNLTGSIPQAMASLTNLEVLNLSYNDLSGSIPTGRQFSTFTSSSYQGGNKGLYGCPLPIRCNLRLPAPAARAPAPPASATAINQSFETVILWLFVGSGYGIGIAVSIVLQMACCGRYMNNTLEKIANWIA